MACMFPFYLKSEHICVPCGKCPECLKRRANGWAFRLRKELENSSSGLFLTLTYSTDYVPITKSGYMTLQKKDCQDFMKRLRRDLWLNYRQDVKLKYYLCGEYGATTMRPHYHLLLFNYPQQYKLQLAEHLDLIWRNGAVDIGNGFAGVTPQSTMYVLKYMSKPKRIPLHANDDRLPEFSLMSKGLGKSYLSDEIVQYHSSDLKRCYLTLPGGQKIAMPRYYKDKLYSDVDREIMAQIFQRMADDDEQSKQNAYLKEHGNLDRYYIDRFQAFKQYLDNYFRKSQQNRNNL